MKWQVYRQTDSAALLSPLVVLVRQAGRQHERGVRLQTQQESRHGSAGSHSTTTKQPPHCHKGNCTLATNTAATRNNSMAHCGSISCLWQSSGIHRTTVTYVTYVSQSVQQNNNNNHTAIAKSNVIILQSGFNISSKRI